MLRPVGSPMSAVLSPTRKITWCPSCWKWRSLRIRTVWPRCRSGAVGSKPAFTRRGRPVLRLSSRRSCRSLTRIISAAPFSSRSICSSTDGNWGMSSSSIKNRDQGLETGGHVERKGRTGMTSIPGRLGVGLAILITAIVVVGGGAQSAEEQAIRQVIATYAHSIDTADTAIAEQIWSHGPEVSFIHPLGEEHGLAEIKADVYRDLMGTTFS